MTRPRRNSTLPNSKCPQTVRRLISSEASAPSWLPIGTRLFALFLLAIGGLVWMNSMQSAMGQYPQSGFNDRNGNFAPQPFGQSRTPNGFTNANAQGGIPSMPTAETLSPTESVTAEPVKAATPWELPAFVKKISQGGWLMIPLGICSLIVLSLSFERLIALRRSRVIPRPFVRRFTECVEDGQLSYEEATEICEEFDCPVAEVFRAAVRRWGRPMFEVEQAVMDAGDRVADGLKRFLRIFHAISNVAPLLGLLGTVLGMIQAFETISSQETIGRPEALASGISVALITTAGGLAVAIPAYLAYMYFSSKSDRYLNEIDKLCQKVVDCISAEGLESSGATRTRKKRAA